MKGDLRGNFFYTEIGVYMEQTASGDVEAGVIAMFKRCRQVY